MISPAERIARRKAKNRKSAPPGTGKLRCLCRPRRLEMQLTIQDVVDGTGLAAGSISEIERGAELTVSSALRLASFYGTTMDELWPMPRRKNNVKSP